MKKLGFVTVIFVFLLFVSNGIQAQTTQTQRNQLELVKQFLGTWQANTGKDTMDVWECRQHGKAFIENGSLIINGKKSFNYEETYGFSSKEGKFKGFVIYPTGTYMTWIGSFTSEKKMSGDIVRDFNPGAVTGKFEAVIETPTSITFTFLNTSGVKTQEVKYQKIK